MRAKGAKGQLINIVTYSREKNHAFILLQCTTQNSRSITFGNFYTYRKKSLAKRSQHLRKEKQENRRKNAEVKEKVIERRKL